MPSLLPHELAQFARKYRFAGARVRRIRILPRKGGGTVEVVLKVTPAITDLGADAPQPVRLVIRVDGVEEFRLQKRPNTSPGRAGETRFATFNGLIYVNFDAWGLQPGEVLGVHDFRASDLFVAGRQASWEVIQPGERSA